MPWIPPGATIVRRRRRGEQQKPSAGARVRSGLTSSRKSPAVQNFTSVILTNGVLAMAAEANATARRRRIGPGATLLIVIAAPLLLAALFIVGFKVSGRRGLNAELERIRAAGEPASAGELE